MLPLECAELSLAGLSVGDAFGERFFLHAQIAQSMIQHRALPKEPWPFTDDTNMALSIYATLRIHQEISQDYLAQSFAEHYDLGRGYGAAMHGLLRRLTGGEDWRLAANSLFEGQGSFGNGAAMRVAPIGAYFASDLDRVVHEATKSAEVTHAHPEGIAGAVAVAVAAACAVNCRGNDVTRQAFIDIVLPYVPDSEVRSGIKRARDIQTTHVEHVVAMIGNGYQITAQDTVPFTLWCAGEEISSFEDAMWLTASGLGDIDTNCAIVGGIVSLYVGYDDVPDDWLDKREALPQWAFEDTA